MQDTHKRFDDWIPVDCNQCAKYWDSSCDGVKCHTNSDKGVQGSTRLCNSFIACRSVDIPAKIKSLQNDVKWLIGATVCLGTSLLIHLLIHFLGG